MATGVWDGLDKDRVAKAMVTAFMSDEYLETLAAINNAETMADLEAARAHVKDLMALWREEAPEYAFVIDALFIFSEKMQVQLAGEADCRALTPRVPASMLRLPKGSSCFGQGQHPCGASAAWPCRRSLGTDRRDLWHACACQGLFFGRVNTEEIP